jgi:Trk K+ transport system NAD-binding subunit
VVTGEDDRENLEIALAARQRNANLRVVIRLFDEGMAHGVERAAGFVALSSDFLAAPAFVAAATDESIVAAFDVDGATLALFGDEDHAKRGATTNPTAVVRRGHGLSLDDGTEGDDDHMGRGGGTAPGGSTAPKDGTAPVDGTAPGGTAAPGHGHERLWVSLRGVVPGVQAGQSRGRKAARERDHRRLPGRVVRPGPARTITSSLERLLYFPVALWRHAGPTVKALLVTSLAMLVVSVVVFSVFMGLNPLDAFYFVIATITTTGYGDINLSGAGWALKVYGTLMMFAGAATLAVLFALVADYFLTERIETLLGRRKVDLRDHVVVVGLGRVGYRVAQALRALGETVVAIELDGDSDKVAAARLQMPVVVGSATRAAVLAQAGVERARALIAATDDTMLNVAVALQAREHNADLVTVVRAFDAETASRLGGLCFHALLSTSAIAAPMFADAALRRDVLASFRWNGEDVLVMRWTTPDGGMPATGLHAPAGVAPVLVAECAGALPRLVRPQEVLEGGRSVVVLGLRG